MINQQITLIHALEVAKLGCEK